jgi:recombination protein RecT
MSEQPTAVQKYENYKNIVSYGQSQEVMNTFIQVLGKEAPYYVQSAIMAVKLNDRLMECTPRSIFSAALRAATLRLSCDPALGHAFMVPYRNNGVPEASFQPGWKGIQHMALRTGKYDYINVAKIYDGEEIVEDRFSGEITIQGMPTYPKKEIGLLASFRLKSGLKKSIYMTYEELEAHGQRYSKSYNRSDSIWKTNKPAAYHKTIVLKLLRNYGYISPLEASILNEDEEPEIADLELPKESEVTIVQKESMSLGEASRAMGFEDDEAEEAEYIVDPIDPEVVEAEVVEPEPEPIHMTIEEACAVTNSNGVRYGTMDESVLAKILSNLWKRQESNGLTDEEKAETEMKIKAAQTILAAKKDGSMK